MTLLPFSLRLCFLLFFVVSVPLTVISQLDERSTLLKLKRELGDPPSLRSWDDESSPCNWPEIKCSDGNVSEISFYNQNFTSPVPDSICDFPNLRLLDLSYNYFPGEFPIVLYNCKKLQHLDISQNLFKGLLPDDIDRLSGELVYVDLGANEFSGNIPKSIGRLSKLKVLNLNQCEYNGTFPTEIGDLSELEELRLATNDKFLSTTIPTEFGKLTKLKYLWLAEMNLIGEIPAVVFESLTALEHVDLSANSLQGEIPDVLFGLKNLTYLYLYDNNLTGEIPRSISAMNLMELDLSKNNLNGSIPEVIGNLTKLDMLNLFLNQLTGEIPEGIGRIPELKLMKLFNNRLTGKLPPDLGFYSKLERLEVFNNQLTGKLPENLCKGDNLLGVVVYSNNMTGKIPQSLGNCRTLLTIQVQNNRFSGEIPAGIWTISGMEWLMLSNNSFAGELPENVAMNLSIIEIENNRFSGKIPQKIGSWSNLTVLKASNNRISGEIPKELTSLSQIQTISLAGNQLSGELPAEFISWETLNILDLSNNKLSGNIPAALGSLPNLINLDLSENQFTGQIPPEIGNLRPTNLNFSSNRLSGKIPDQYNNLAFEFQFQNNLNLCANDPIIRLPDCRRILRNTKGISEKTLGTILAIAILAFTITLFITFFTIRNYRKKQQRGTDKETWKLTSFHRLDFSESDIISKLTDNNIIGSGGSGKVYKISINSSGQQIAVKRIWNNKELDEKLKKEFAAEVEILGTIRHANIVKLLCCISSEDSKLLVYEYMVNRSLDQWLHGKKRDDAESRLDWLRRSHIAVGVAHGLCYMHHESFPAIIHRDIKSSNILLDSEFNAKIADFGLAKILVNHRDKDHHTMSTVAGSFGYIAPEYEYTSKVNEKSDVYSFGVVLLELVTGREGNKGDEYTNLADWSWKHYQAQDPISDMFDPEIKNEAYKDEMTRVFNLGLMCTSTLPNHRPSMKEVLHILRINGKEEGYGIIKPGGEAPETRLLVSQSGRRGRREGAVHDCFTSPV